MAENQPRRIPDYIAKLNGADYFIACAALDRIDALDEIIQSGVSSVTVDGTTTKFDLKEARTERDSLLTRFGIKKPRPLFTPISTRGV